MKDHKSKILSLCIASALLYGCGSDDSDSNSMDVQAYDGPVRGMVANYECEDGTQGTGEATGDDGFTELSGTFAVAPELCSVSFTGGSNAVDMENGRDMSGVVYSAPKGLFSAGGKATASPLTTLIAKHLGDREYNEADATDILGQLGLDELANTGGISIKNLLTDTESATKTLKSNSAGLFSKFAATKMILSDVVAAQPNIDPSKIASVTKTLSESIVGQFPNFPLDNSGTEIVVNLKEKLKESGIVDKIQSGELTKDDLVDIIEDNKGVATKPEPTDPDQPATGGTGGTGGTGSTGGGA